MSKAGNEYTDKQIEELEKELTEVYSRAGDELEKKASAYFARFEKQDKEKQKLVAEGKMTQADYNKWRTGSMMTGQRWKTLKEQSAKTLLEANKNAVKLANGKLPSIYMFNYNETGKDAQEEIKGLSFDLINERALARMLKDKTTVLPFKEVDGKKVERWDTRKINAEVTQGIIQGESVQKIAKRFRNVSEMDKRYSLLNARTAMTGAENRGTLDGMQSLEDDGVILQKVWISSHDRRVRKSHQHIDGESVPVKEEFSNGLMYPGDPDGDDEEVYGCRCSMTTEILGFKSMSGHTIAQGRDISETWQRRPDKFDFEIEDVMNAQGFDGKPRVVSADEFDELVKQANDGNGFIAQRTYSASDQETLDAYREQLYDGKWYVDCGTGGSQYGQGMYCAADYNGQLTDGIKIEMQHYKELNEGRFAFQSRHQEVSDLRTEDADKAYSDIVKNANLTDVEKLIFKVEKENRGSAEEIDRVFDIMSEMSKDERRSMLSKLNSVYANATEARRSIFDISIEDYAKQHGIDLYYKPVSYTETLTLDSSAKIINYNDLNFEFNKYVSDRMQYWSKKIDKTDEFDFDEMQKVKANRDAELKLLRNMDVGSFAALNGYDAINAKGHGESGSYTVILNRTKLIIKEPEK